MSRPFDIPPPEAPATIPGDPAPTIAPSTESDTVDITDEQGRNPGEPGFGDGDDGHLHADETDSSSTDAELNTPPNDEI